MSIEKLGRYEIIGEIGKGAMGIVYEARDPRIDRVVAIKTLRLDYAVLPAQVEELRTRFYREAQAAGKLAHPSIVMIYDVGEEGDLSYFVMEFIKGKSLEKILKTSGSFDLEKAIEIILQTCDALDYAHQNGIVHRDIKPANVMLLDDGRVKVADFGIARISTSTMTQTGRALGTPSYMSPEQISGQKVDGRSDIFSLGAVFYELITGEKAFPGESITTIIYRILHEDPVSPTKLNFQLPSSIDRILNKSMAKNPMNRYQTAKEFAEDIRNYQKAEMVSPKSEIEDATVFQSEATRISTSAPGETVTAIRGVKPQVAKKSSAEVAREKAERYIEKEEKPKKKGLVYGMVGAIAALILIAGGYLFLGKESTPQKEITPPVSRAVVPKKEEPQPAREIKVEPKESVKTVKEEPVKPVSPTTETKKTIAKETAPPVKTQPSVSTAPRTAEPPKTAKVESERKGPSREVTIPSTRETPQARPEQTERKTEERVAVSPPSAEPKPALQRFGSIRINATPWADITLDGRAIGSTPQTINQVPVGLHRVKLSNPRFPPYEIAVNVTENSTVDVIYSFAPSVGTLFVNSTPWSNVYVDGKLEGPTPLTINKISAGKHQIKLVRDGYQGYTETVEIKGGQTAKISVKLEK